jgi:branched-chain amino acid transport system permease protein
MKDGLAETVKESAALAGLVMALTLPIAGLQTVIVNSRLSISPHLGLVAIFGAIAFVARLLWLSYRQYRPVRQTAGPSRLGVVVARVGPWFGRLALAAALVMPFISSGFVIDVGTNILIYVILGWGLNIVVGLAGLLDLGYVAFYAVGAYTVGILSSDFGLGWWECLPLAGLFAAAFGIVLGFPVLRLRGDYLAIVTLGFGEIIRIVIINWVSVTQGPNGIGGIPRPTFFGMPLSAVAPEGKTTFAEFFGIDFAPEQRLIFLYFVVLGLALVTNFLTQKLRRLPIGRAWEALREDEIACRAIGINATNVKLSAFAIGAMFGGLAGACFAARLSFISPESFTFSESATILAIVVLGGMGSQLGVVLAAAVLVSLPAVGQWLGTILPQIGQALGDPIQGPLGAAGDWFGSDFAQYRMLLFGAAMVAIMVTRPRGLISHRRPSILLGPSPAR